MTYTIAVKNTGGEDVYDLSVEDQVPYYLEVLSVYPKPSQKSGNYILWENQTVETGDTEEFTITARVKTSAPNGTSLVNHAEAASNDYDLSEEDDDTTIVEYSKQVAGTWDDGSGVIAGTTSQSSSVSVPVSAKTGAGLLGLLSSLIGGSGLAFVLRRW